MSSNCLSSVKMFGGEQNRYQHHSDVLDCDMAAALTGITSYLMCLFSQTLYAEAEVREKDTYEDLTQYYVNGGK